MVGRLELNEGSGKERRRREGRGGTERETSPEAGREEGERENVMYVSQSLTYSVLDRNMNAREIVLITLLFSHVASNARCTTD